MENTILIILISVSLFFSATFTLFVIIYLIKKNFFLKLDRKISRPLNKSKNYSMYQGEKKQVFYILADALKLLASSKIGALICIQKKDSLANYVSSGVTINSNINTYLLIAIFNKTTPLHDGAVIIVNNKIASASSYLPIQRKKMDPQFGSRHRAALGLTKETDAICYVVSETDGSISLARAGRIYKININDIYQAISNT